MPLPRPTLPSPAVLRRPAVLAPVTASALAGLLATGLLVANAVDAPPASPVSASTSPAPPADSSSASDDESAAAAGSAGEAATTTSGGDDNVAVAVNTRDGSTVYAVRLKVVLTGADVVDAGNAAVAVASCTDCQTVSIALEGVLVTGDAEVVAPENIALAINSGCSGCSTLAYAYQDLRTVDGRVRLTGEGRRRIGQLRQQLNGLRRAGLDIVAVRDEVDRIARDFAAVLAQEVVTVGPAAPASPSPSPSPSPSFEPGATEPDPSASSVEPTQAPVTPTPVPSAEVLPTPTATPTPSDG